MMQGFTTQITIKVYQINFLYPNQLYLSKNFNLTVGKGLNFVSMAHVFQIDS